MPASGGGWPNAAPLSLPCPERVATCGNRCHYSVAFKHRPSGGEFTTGLDRGGDPNGEARTTDRRSLRGGSLRRRRCGRQSCSRRAENPCSPERLGAFHGAMGWAATTPGGRGGRIIRVTTLAPEGPGSPLEALTAKGPRIVVFEIAGHIDLGKRDVKITGTVSDDRRSDRAVARHHPGQGQERRGVHA